MDRGGTTLDPITVVFAGTFAASLETRVRAHLTRPCEIGAAAESAVAALMPDVDVLVTMAFTPEMGRLAKRLKLVQVPGAGLDRIDRAALRRAPRWPTSTVTRSGSPNTCWARCWPSRANFRGSTRR